MWNKISKIYVGTHQVRPNAKIMTMADINEQSEFEAQSIVPWSTVVVSWTNPTTYGYSSAVRYWGGQTKVDIPMPIKGEFFIDCVFGSHNRDSESAIWLYGYGSSLGPIWIQQGTLTVSTSEPKINIPWGDVQPISVNFMDGNRHTIKITWDTNVYNARVDNTQVITNKSGTTITSSDKFRFIIFWWAQNWIIQKSIYDFYVKDLS